MPTNSQYQKKTNKFLCSGFASVTPGDLTVPGKFRKLLNARVRRAGIVTGRPGTTNFFPSADPGPALAAIHSAKKWKIGATSIILFLGNGTKIQTADSVAGYSDIDTGPYSGHPLRIVVAKPVLVGDTWGYFYDRDRQRKYGTALKQIGIPAPGKDGNTNWTITAAGAPTAVSTGAGSLDGVYFYKYRYRESTLGVKSNSSAALADPGITVTPATGQVTVTMTAPLNDGGQATTIDVFRLGGTLTTYRLAGSVTLPTVTFVDSQADSAIASADLLDETLYQPWVTTDSAGVTKANKPLHYAWGPFAGSIFAVGDSSNPGLLYWTNPNDPDSMDIANFIEVTGPNEPLIGGFVFAGKAFCYSNETFYAIYQSTSGITSFEVLPTACGRGPVSPWAVTVGDRIYFVARDGVFATNGGPEISLSPDIYNLFPHEGSVDEPRTFNDIIPPEGGQLLDSRLEHRDGMLWFDYEGDGAGGALTLTYDFAVGGWFPDSHASAGKPIMHYGIEGSEPIIGDPAYAARKVVLGTDNGELFVYDHGARDDEDDATPDNFIVDVWTPLEDFGDPRTQKLWGDTIVELDRADLTVTITPVFDNDAVAEAATTVSTGSGRQTIIISHNSGNGRLARNMGLKIAWTVDADSTTRDGPHLYAWHPSAITKPDESILRAMEWHPFTPDEQDAYVWGIDLWIDTEGSDVVFEVHRDGSASGVTFTANATGERKLRFSWHATNFPGRLGKLIPQSAETDNWRLTKWEWLYNKAPIEAPDFDTWWTSPLGEGQTMYVTGVKVKISTDGISKALLFQSELEGAFTVHTAREGNNVTTLGPQPETLTFAFEPFRASLLSVHSVDGVDARFHWAKWIVHPEPPPLANWDATFKDFGAHMAVRGVEIFADTLGLNKSVRVELDTTLHTTLTVNHNGRLSRFYPMPVDGNGEFPRASTARLFPADDATDSDAYFYRVRWISRQEPELLANWNPEWTDAGHPGAKFVQGVRVTADTKNLSKTFNVQYTDTTGTLKTNGPHTVQFPIRDTKVVSFAIPFIAHNLRVVPTDANAGYLYGTEFIWEPAPDLATTWKTQEMTYGLPGYFHDRDGYIAISDAAASVSLVRTIDNVAQTAITIPASTPFAKQYVTFKAAKGRAEKWALTSASPFRLFRNASEVRVKAWGDGGAYRTVLPFGDVHAESGARI